MTIEERFDSVLSRLRTRLSRRKRSSSVNMLDENEEEAQLNLDKRKRASSLRSRHSVRKLQSREGFKDQQGKLELLDNGQPVVTIYPNQQFNEIQSVENLHYPSTNTPRTVDNWSSRFRELQQSLRASRNHLSSPHTLLSRQQSVLGLPLPGTPVPSRSFKTASAEHLLERDLDHNSFKIPKKSSKTQFTYFPVNPHINSPEYDIYGGYVLPEFRTEETHIEESGYGSTAATNTTHRHTSEESHARSESILGVSEDAGSEKIENNSRKKHFYLSTPKVMPQSEMFYIPALAVNGEREHLQYTKDLGSKNKRKEQQHQNFQHSRLNFSPKSLETLMDPDSQRYARARTEMAARRGARSEMDIHRLHKRYSSVMTNSTYEAIEFLRMRIKETKYVTAVFESTKGGLAPVLGDIMKEFAHWLGAKSRLLAVACEVHWSVPEKFRSRAMEIQMKDSLHKALRDNNRRVLNLYDECRRGLPSSFIKSKTEENCSHDAKLDAFQGIYRRYYPEMLSLQDPTTVISHKSYWTLKNLNNVDKNPLRPSPAKFLHQPTISQLGRKSVVAVNMATLRLEGDEVNYDAESVRSQEVLL